ncbi:hypothetical protein L6452_32310 [Arctium lappa]|uniref:Uncharacterized protein n=1 Tax=Arctium lappa TaxID=4217 RepID=A0ACB8Z4A5_ARCLA|nr:hypothetical protein L6452_32310 [Arctium lappa]
MEKLMFQKSLILKKIQLLQNELTLIDTEMEFERNHEQRSSSSSLDSLNLRPNGDFQNPQKCKVHPLVQSQDCQGIKAYYVVFNGPKAGIYTSWNVAEIAVKGISGVKHKKYKSYEEARVSANIYTAAEYKAPLELISSSEGLRPSFSTVLTRELSFVEEHYYTTNKRNISYFNFFSNTHPEFVLEAYQYGLFRMIYPSDNFLELSKFPA